MTDNVKCSRCDKSFYRRPAQLRKDLNFCSHVCWAAWIHRATVRFQELEDLRREYDELESEVKGLRRFKRNVYGEVDDSTALRRWERG